MGWYYLYCHNLKKYIVGIALYQSIEIDYILLIMHILLSGCTKIWLIIPY